MSIHIRNYSRKDIKALRRMSRKAWPLEKYTSHARIKKHMYAIETNEALLYGNYSLSAEKNGEVIGVLFASIPGRKRPFHALKWKLIIAWHLLNLSLVKEGRKLLGAFKQVERGFKQMKRENDVSLESALELFIVDDRFRGEGIGKRLIERFEDTAREKGVESYFLFTDSDSSYGYYDHNGYERIDEKTFTFPGVQAMRFKLYMYHKEI